MNMKCCFMLVGVAVVLVLVKGSVDNQDGEEFLEFNEVRMDTKLQVKPLLIDRSVGEDVLQCLTRCLDYSPLCQGINFLSSADGGEGVCEILEDSFDDQNTRKKLVCAQSWIYYGVSKISVCM